MMTAKYSVDTRCKGSSAWGTNTFSTLVGALKYSIYLMEDPFLARVNLYKNDNLIWSGLCENGCEYRINY